MMSGGKLLWNHRQSGVQACVPKGVPGRVCALGSYRLWTQEDGGGGLSSLRLQLLRAREGDKGRSSRVPAVMRKDVCPMLPQKVLLHAILSEEITPLIQ